MDWKQRLEQSLNQGYDVTRKLFGKAKERAVELGEHGVLSLEVRQLEAKYTDLLTSLGTKVHNLLIHEKRSTVTAKSQGVKELLEQIEETREELEHKRRLLREQEEAKSEESDGASGGQGIAENERTGHSTEEPKAGDTQTGSAGEGSRGHDTAGASGSGSETSGESSTGSGDSDGTERR